MFDKICALKNLKIIKLKGVYIISKTNQLKISQTVSFSNEGWS